MGRTGGAVNIDDFMDVRLPKLGEGAESGTVVSVAVKEGQRVEEGQTLVELENEKAVAPIPSPVAGVVAKLRVKEGDKISVGQILATIDEGGAEKKDRAAGRTPSTAGQRPATTNVGGPPAVSNTRREALLTSHTESEKRWI